MRSPPASSPDEYVAALEGWQRRRVEELRAVVRRESDLDEVVKWGHLTREAIRLNESLGDPTVAARRA